MRPAKGAPTLASSQDHQDGTLEELANRWTHLSPDEILQSPHVRIETVDQRVDGLHACRERWRITYCISFVPYTDVFPPSSPASPAR